MKKLLLAFGLLMVMASTAAAAEAEFIFDIKPLAFLFSSDLDGFKISQSSKYYYISEKIDGTGSWTPSVNMGVGIVTRPVNFDFTAGVGYLFNGAFDGSFYQVDMGAHFNLGPVKLGPHIGYINFNEMTWSESSLVKFDSTGGLKGGIDFTIGHTIYFLASLEYICADEANVAVLNNYWVANAPSVDYSGISYSIGLAGRF